MDVAAVLAGVRAGERRSVARAITLVEGRGAQGREILRSLHPATGGALRIGITGSPGVGKSTLISALIGHLRGSGTTVAIVSVDPTSPFTKGAVLGDRIRLVDHFLDRGVFIRSMASRGHLGGLSEATAGAVLVLDAAGFDVVLVETVGTGQNEVEVQALTETVVLVLMPGSGDSIQAIKAGLMEIPDVLVINKADRPGAELLRAELKATMSWCPRVRGSRRSWRPRLTTLSASPSCGTPSSATAPFWPRERTWTSAATTACAANCAPWPWTAWAAGSTSCATTQRWPTWSRRSRTARSIPTPPWTRYSTASAEPRVGASAAARSGHSDTARRTIWVANSPARRQRIWSGGDSESGFDLGCDRLAMGIGASALQDRLDRLLVEAALARRTRVDE